MEILGYIFKIIMNSYEKNISKYNMYFLIFVNKCIGYLSLFVKIIWYKKKFLVLLFKR